MNKERELRLRFIARMHNQADKKELESLINDCKKFEAKCKRQESLLLKYSLGGVKSGNNVIFDRNEQHLSVPR